MKTKPKSILSVLCLLAITSFFTGCGETVIDADQMQERKGLVYTVSQESPFTGVVVKQYENGQKEWEQRYKDGVKDGRWVEWYENGQKSSDKIYSDGKSVWQSEKEWHENGVIKVEVSLYTTNKTVRTWWHDNGQKLREMTWDYMTPQTKSATMWYSNGQKLRERFWKDTERHGKWTDWDRSGRITHESTYKDGELIEEKIYSPE